MSRRTRALAPRDVGARADPLLVGDQRGTTIVVIFESTLDAAREQAQLSMERRLRAMPGRAFRSHGSLRRCDNSQAPEQQEERNENCQERHPLLDSRSAV